MRAPFVQACAPTEDELHSLLHTVITRLMKMLTRRGVLIEERIGISNAPFLSQGPRQVTH